VRSGCDRNGMPYLIIGKNNSAKETD